MSGWDTLNSQAGGKTTTKKASGWEALNASVQPTRADKIAQYQKEAEASKLQAKQQSSIGGLLKNTIKGLPQASGIPQAFNSGIEQVKTGYNQITSPQSTLVNRGEGLLNAGAGVVNTAFSPLAPVTAPIGKGIQFAGDQLSRAPLIKSYGEAVANAPASYQDQQIPERILEGMVNATTIADVGLGAMWRPKVPTRQIPVQSDGTVSNIPIAKKIPVTSKAETTPINVQTPYIPDNKLPVIPFGKPKPKTVDTLPVIDYSSLKQKPVLPKPKSKEEIFNPVEELKMGFEFSKEALDNNPAKPLLKYVSKTTGRLPEVTGKDTIGSLKGGINQKKVKNSEFGRNGDDIVSQHGFDSVDAAQKAIEEYQQLRERIGEQASVIREKTKSARLELRKQPKPERVKTEPSLRYVPIKGIQNRIETPASSVISYIDKNDNKVFTRISEKELSTLKDEINTIPVNSKGVSQIHLDPDNPRLREVASEVSRDEFIKGHPQAGGILSKGKPETVRVTPIKGAGITKTRGLSLGVEAKAIEKRLTTKLGDLPEYETVSMKDQSQRASKMIREDYQNARSIALGEKTPPKGVLPESVFVAIEDMAIREGDVATLQDLVNSKLSTAATTMGQRIRTLGERDQSSPVAIIQDVQKARRDAIEKKGSIPEAKKNVVSQIEKEIKKTAPTKEDWSSFISSITC